MLNCNLTKDQISVLISLIESGVNPESLVSVVQEIKKYKEE